jgi:CheY-like chemotaxis protein
MAKTCVIGEADPFIGRLLRRFAEESGLQVSRAELGQDVLELVQRARPDIIILEPELPGQMRGWEAVRALQAAPAWRPIPIIVCSWLSEAQARVLIGDVSGYLQKPDLHYPDFATVLKQAGVT